MAITYTLLICYPMIESWLLTKLLLFSVVHTGKWRNDTSMIGHFQPRCSPPVILMEVSSSRSSCTQTGDKCARSSAVSFRRSAAKVKRVEVLGKEICQLCCFVREPESTPPLSKMSRLRLTQPRSKFLRLACKLKRMCIAWEMALCFEWPRSRPKDAFQLFLIILIFWGVLWAKYLFCASPTPHY